MHTVRQSMWANRSQVAGLVLTSFHRCRSLKRSNQTPTSRDSRSSTVGEGKERPIVSCIWTPSCVAKSYTPVRLRPQTPDYPGEEQIVGLIRFRRTIANEDIGQQRTKIPPCRSIHQQGDHCSDHLRPYLRRLRSHCCPVERAPTIWN